MYVISIRFIATAHSVPDEIVLLHNVFLARLHVCICAHSLTSELVGALGCWIAGSFVLLLGSS